MTEKYHAVHKAHELLASINKNDEVFEHIQCAVKFDLGDVDEFQSVADMGKYEFIKIPAPICLFQLTSQCKSYAYLILATEHNLYGDKNKTISMISFWKCEQGWVRGAIRTDFFIDGSWICFDVRSGEMIRAESILEKKNAGEFSIPVYEACLFQGIIKFCEVFSCSNVIQKENHPPKLLNQSRMKKGKIPFFTYRTLHITGESDGGGESTGTHSSPRLHFRRGHIRKIGERMIWVRSCLVGDKSKGFAMKDYSVKINNYEKSNLESI